MIEGRQPKKKEHYTDEDEKEVTLGWRKLTQAPLDTLNTQGILSGNKEGSL